MKCFLSSLLPVTLIFPIALVAMELEEEGKKNAASLEQAEACLDSWFPRNFLQTQDNEDKVSAERDRKMSQPSRSVGRWVEAYMFQEYEDKQDCERKFSGGEAHGVEKDGSNFAFFMLGDKAGRSGLPEVLTQSIIDLYHGSEGYYTFKHTLRPSFFSIGETVAALNYNGSCAASGSFEHDFDVYITLWNVQTKRRIGILKGHDGFISSLAFSHDDLHVLSAATDGTVKWWDIGTGKCVFTMEHESDLADDNSHIKATLNHNSSRVASVGYDGTIKVWGIQTGNRLLTINNGPNSHLSAAVFNHDSSLIACPSHRNIIKMWNAHNGNLVGILSGGDAPVVSLVFSPDGSHMATGLADGSIIVWNVQERQRVYTIPKAYVGAVCSVCFSPRGSLLLSAGANALGGQTIKVWDAETGIYLNALQGEGGEGSSASFSGDGKRIVSVLKPTGEVGIWEAESSLLPLVKAARVAHRAGLSEAGVRRVLDAAPGQVNQAIADEQRQQQQPKKKCYWLEALGALASKSATLFFMPEFPVMLRYKK